MLPRDGDLSHRFTFDNICTLDKLTLIMTTLGQYIRQARDAKDFSLREFAEKIACSPAFLSDIELGRRHPSDKVFEKIAETLGISLAELKKYDTRPATEDFRVRSQNNPQYAFAFRKMMDSNIDPKDIIKFAEKNAGKKKPEKS